MADYFFRMRFAPMTMLAAVAALFGAVRPAGAIPVDFFVYNVTLKLVVQEVTPGGIVVTRKLGNDEIVNLALGRPLTTKVDKKTEILAGAGTYAEHASESKLIVFDPSQNGPAQVTATVGTLSALDFENAGLPSKTTFLGFGTAQFAPTTLGDPAHNGFLQSTLQGGGNGSGTHDPFGLGQSKVAAKGSMTGRVRFVFTDTNGTQTFDGFVLKGQAKAGGKALGSFTQ